MVLVYVLPCSVVVSVRLVVDESTTCSILKNDLKHLGPFTEHCADAMLSL
jgi:hypothetical protein